MRKKSCRYFTIVFLIFVISSRMSSSSIQCRVRNLHTYWNCYSFSLSEKKFESWQILYLIALFSSLSIYYFIELSFLSLRIKPCRYFEIVFLIFLIPSRMSSSRIQCLVRNLHTYWNGYLFSLSEIILKVDKFFTWLLFFHHSLYLLLHRISISFIKHGILN